MSRADDLSQFDYELPPELIAKEPLAERDASRLMVVDRESQSISHHKVRDLPDLLHPGDCLVMNNSRVIPARILGKRTATGGKWEGLFLSQLNSGLWHLMGSTRGKLSTGETITLDRPHGESDAGEPQLLLTLIEKQEDGSWTAQPNLDQPPVDLLNQFGTVPLPPYIQRQLATSNDWARYQTIYADQDGSVAAPTAGLHFTDRLIDACSACGIAQVFVTLHVGVGTFRPITVSALDKHDMHSEFCEISSETVTKLNQIQSVSGRIVAVGTTSVRTLESAAGFGKLEPFRGPTNLFIRPPYQFRSVDVLLTNFHLPKSTLFVLVSAFAGRELIQRAYQEAIRSRYRFYSYGDAMLIL